MSHEVHIARHYLRLPLDYRLRLINHGICPAQLDIALETKGSKFVANLRKESIETPQSLITRIFIEAKRLQQARKLRWKTSNSRRLVVFCFETTYPVGEDRLVEIDTLTLRERARVSKSRRGGLQGDDCEILTVTGKHPTLTRHITVEMSFAKSEPCLFHMTAYPGVYAPDFPSQHQTQSQCRISQTFWDTHVFIDSPKRLTAFI